MDWTARPPAYLRIKQTATHTATHHTIPLTMSSYDRQSDNQSIISPQPQSSTASTHLSVWEDMCGPVDRDGTVRTQVASSNEAAPVDRDFDRPRLSFRRMTTGESDRHLISDSLSGNPTKLVLLAGKT